jgi:glycosyltransferase involved in cell wall biosynthesis
MGTLSRAIGKYFFQNTGAEMKFAVDAYHTISLSGGIVRYARCLISAIAEIALAEEIILFINRFRERGKTWKPESGIHDIRQFYFPRRMLQNAWDTFEWPPIELLCGPVDLYHGLHFVLPPVRKARRVLTVHDLTYLKFPEFFSDRKLNEKGYRQELPKGLKRADMVIAVSKQTAEDLIDLMKVPEEKVRVIYEGVAQQFFKHVESRKAVAIREGYGLTQPYIVFLVGTPEPRKNLTNTIAAARKASPNLTLVLIGPKSSLRALLEGDHHNIKFTGIVPEGHLPSLLSGAKISLYPSLYEGFGLPVLESMACGVPVIASTQGALPEIAGEAAILVDPEDVDSIAEAVNELLHNDALQNHLKAAGKNRAAEFTWQKAAEATLSLYRELV